MSVQSQIDSVAIPAGEADYLAKLLRRRWLMLAIARGLGFVGKMRSKPIPAGERKFVLHHAQIKEALSRDADFLIAASYEHEMALTNGPFVLGMDRGPQLSAESHALYKALGAVDLKAVTARAGAEAEALLAKLGADFDAVQDYIWPICGSTAQHLFGLSHIDPALFRHVARAIFYHVFYDAKKSKAVAARAEVAGSMMKGWIDAEVAKRRKAGPKFYGDDYLGQLLRNDNADDHMIQRTVGGMLIGSIDTISGVAARIIAQLPGHPKLRQRMTEVLHNPAKLNGYCLEAHRLWAQTPLVTRRAAHDTKLGDLDIKKGDALLLMTQAGMFDSAAFHHPTELRPDRPLTSYLHYGGGVHACSGAALSNAQVPMLVGKLLERGFRATGKLKWAGPFPNSLPVTVDRN